MLDIYYIRHAESMGNINRHIIGGQSDHLPLTERGAWQAKKLGGRLREEQLRFDAVFSSPAIRAHETARIVCRELEHPESGIDLSEALRELSQGEWEGKIRADYYDDKRRQSILEDPWHFAAPGGESPRQVEDRMYAFAEEKVLPLMGTAGSIGVFSHSFAIRCLLRRILDYHPGMTYRTVIHNTSITHLQFEEAQWRVVRVNDHAHLIGTDFVGHYGS